MSSNPLSIIERITGDKSGIGAKELTTNLVKIRGKTLVFGDTIYQIPNIAAIEVRSFSKEFPFLSVIGVLISLLVFRTKDPILILLGLGIGFWSGYFIYRYWYKKNTYGLLILLNSGIEASTIIVWPDKEFIQEVSVVLYNIMNDEDYDRAINIQFDQRHIQDITISDITESTVITGSSIQGDIVNKIE